MTTHTVAHELVKTAPPVAVSAWISIGPGELDMWIKGLTLLYLVLQISWVAVKLAKSRIPVKVESD